MRPHERHRRPRRPTETHADRGSVGGVPHLLREQPRRGGETLHGAKIRADVAPGGELVVSALAGEERPGPAPPPAVVRPAAVALPVAIVVVPTPARAEGRLHFERRVHHAQRILYDRLTRLHDPISDELEESRIDDLLGRELGALANAEDAIIAPGYVLSSTNGTVAPIASQVPCFSATRISRPAVSATYPLFSQPPTSRC